MNKRELIQEVKQQGFPLTEGALRTYISERYKLIVVLGQSKAGTSNQYTDQHVEQICEIVAANRLGLRLSKMKQYLASPDKQLHLFNQILANKKHVQEQCFYWNGLLQLTREIEAGQHQECKATELYFKMTEKQCLRGNKDAEY